MGSHIHVNAQLTDQELDGVPLPCERCPVDGLGPLAIFYGYTSLVTFKQQPGHVNMPTLDGIHEGCEAAAVPAVGFILAPAVCSGVL